MPDIGRDAKVVAFLEANNNKSMLIWLQYMGGTARK